MDFISSVISLRKSHWSKRYILNLLWLVSRYKQYKSSSSSRAPVSQCKDRCEVCANSKVHTANVAWTTRDTDRNTLQSKCMTKKINCVFDHFDNCLYFAASTDMWCCKCKHWCACCLCPAENNWNSRVISVHSCAGFLSVWIQHWRDQCSSEGKTTINLSYTVHVYNTLLLKQKRLSAISFKGFFLILTLMVRDKTKQLIRSLETLWMGIKTLL